MATKSLLRATFLAAIALAGLMVLSKELPAGRGGTRPDATTAAQCEPAQAQTEFILWESLSRNILGNLR